jgi:hypothetical protein
MKALICLITILSISSCVDNSSNSSTSSVEGTWKLISGTIIEKEDTTVTVYNKNVSFIKILNKTHFAFLQHDLKKGQDSNAIFVSGGGRYSLINNNYTEHLEYCSARDWEGNDFNFTIFVKGDTLIQTGVEKVENLGINRLNIEKYVRLPIQLNIK